MKTILIIAALAFAVSATFAQPTKTPKKDTTVKIVKPTFEQSLKANDVIPFKIIGGVTIQQAQDYLFFESVGEARMSHANDVTAADFTRMKENHELVLDSLRRKFGREVLLYTKARQAKFTADTTALYKKVIH